MVGWLVGWLVRKESAVPLMGAKHQDTIICEPDVKLAVRHGYQNERRGNDIDRLGVSKANPFVSHYALPPIATRREIHLETTTTVTFPLTISRF